VLKTKQILRSQITKTAVLDENIKKAKSVFGLYSKPLAQQTETLSRADQVDEFQCYFSFKIIYFSSYSLMILNIQLFLLNVLLEAAYFMLLTYSTCNEYQCTAN